MTESGKIAVLGGGAWGTALACAALRAGSGVSLWARNAEVVAALNEGRGNPLYLPKIDLPDGSRTTAQLQNGVPYFREVGVEHDVINGNDFECAFVEVEFLR